MRAAAPTTALLALLLTATESAAPSSTFFLLRFSPGDGSALTLPNGTSAALTTAPLLSIARDVGRAPLPATVVLAPADSATLAALSAATLPASPSCLRRHNVSLPASGAWSTSLTALVYGDERMATARHRDLRLAGTWGTAILMPPTVGVPYVGGAIVVGTTGGPLVTVVADDALWTLVGWPTSTPHEVTAVTAGVRVVFRAQLAPLDEGTGGDADDACGGAALGDAVDAAVPATDRAVLRWLAASVDEAAPYADTAEVPIAAVPGGEAVAPAALPCVHEFVDAASCHGAQSAAGADGAMFCEWTADGVCALVVGCALPLSQTATPSSSHTGTPSSSHSGTPSSSQSGTPSASHTGTPSSSHTGTPSSSHTGTPSASHTGTPSSSHTGTPSSSHTGTPSASHTGTPSSSHTGTPSSSHTGTPSASHTGTPSSSHTGTPSSSNTGSHVPSHTSTVTGTSTRSGDATPLIVATGPNCSTVPSGTYCSITTAEAAARASTPAAFTPNCFSSYERCFNGAFKDVTAVAAGTRCLSIGGVLSSANQAEIVAVSDARCAAATLSPSLTGTHSRAPSSSPVATHSPTVTHSCARVYKKGDAGFVAGAPCGGCK